MSKNKTTQEQDQAIIDELQHALRFYADPTNWERNETVYGNHRLPSTAMLDEGHIAKRALKSIGEEV